MVYYCHIISYQNTCSTDVFFSYLPVVYQMVQNANILGLFVRKVTDILPALEQRLWNRVTQSNISFSVRYDLLIYLVNISHFGCDYETLSAPTGEKKKKQILFNVDDLVVHWPVSQGNSYSELALGQEYSQHRVSHGLLSPQCLSWMRGIFEVKNIFKYHNTVSWQYDHNGSLWEKHIQGSELPSGRQRQHALECIFNQKIFFLFIH